mgnify:CR=1 FL=1
MLIGAVEAFRMEEAKARILAIVSPPMAEVGATYMGKVVNITKFGAFVNILPGRDGLVHISKMGGGKRIEKVEDVLAGFKRPEGLGIVVKGDFVKGGGYIFIDKTGNVVGTRPGAQPAAGCGLAAVAGDHDAGRPVARLSAGGGADARASASPDTLTAGLPLVDRQHPHDLFMELSASYSHRLDDHSSVFVYAGLPGEPAFGPPAFMHRVSAMDSPEAPITHHWMDSTHITFGVLTGGFVRENWKLEASRFTGREPDEHRYDIETPKLDSTAIRVSWNPGPTWSLQASWADLISPEALEPATDERRWSASAIRTVPVGAAGLWSTTIAWGRKDRSEFFRDELGQFLKLVNTEQLPATAVKGSFAGAINPHIKHSNTGR